MSVAEMREILKKEYGICSEAEFEDAVAKSKGIDIGIFTSRPETAGGDEQQI